MSREFWRHGRGRPMTRARFRPYVYGAVVLWVVLAVLVGMQFYGY